jgi:cutC family protein
MTYSNPSVYMGAEGADEDTIMLTTERRVRNTINAVIGKIGQD